MRRKLLRVLDKLVLVEDVVLQVEATAHLPMLHIVFAQHAEKVALRPLGRALKRRKEKAWG